MVFVIYHRITHAKEEDSTKFDQFAIAEKIYKEWIIDLPKLLEIYYIYAETNPKSVICFFHKSIEVCPKLEEDFKDFPPFLEETILD